MHHGHDKIMLEHLESTFGEKQLEAGRWRGLLNRSGAWFSHWRCMALFINFDFYIAFELLQAFRDEAKWCWPGLVKRHGGNVIDWRFYVVDVYHQRWRAWWSLEGVLWGILFKVFPPFPFLTWRPVIQGLELYFVFFFLHIFFVSLCFGVGGLNFPGYTMLIVFVRLLPDSNNAFVSVTYGKYGRGGRR